MLLYGQNASQRVCVCVVSLLSTRWVKCQQQQHLPTRSLGRIKRSWRASSSVTQRARIRVSNTQAEVKGQRDLTDVNGAQPPPRWCHRRVQRDDPFYLALVRTLSALRRHEWKLVWSSNKTQKYLCFWKHTWILKSAHVDRLIKLHHFYCYKMNENILFIINGLEQKYTRLEHTQKKIQFVHRIFQNVASEVHRQNSHKYMVRIIYNESKQKINYWVGK